MMTPQYGNQETYIPSSGLPLHGDKVSFYSRLTCLFLDRTTLYPKSRWLALFLLIGLFSLRIYTYQGFYIVTYALAIYLLNLFLGFITPRVDPEEEDYILPIRETDEFRPFQRRVNEFKFWLQATKGTLLSLLATCFPILDLPVFWPVLVVYFSFLFIITMRQQIKHMIKYKYVPFSWGKQSYGAITRQRSPKGKFTGKSFTAGFPSMQAKSENLIS